MAAYKEHVSVSGLLGIGYGLIAIFMLSFTPVQAALAGCLTWVAGMLPDLDSDSGKPVREVFGLVSAVVPMLAIRHLIVFSGGDAEACILFGIILWATIRYGGAALLGEISVHRGMFHSIPAMLIAAELTFVAYKTDVIGVRLLMAAGVAIGFFSHLLLDEVYSVQWNGVGIKVSKSAGSAIKLVGRDLGPNVLTYSLLFALTFASFSTVGLVGMPDDPVAPPIRMRRAEGEAPEKPLDKTALATRPSSATSVQ